MLSTVEAAHETIPMFPTQKIGGCVFNAGVGERNCSSEKSLYRGNMLSFGLLIDPRQPEPPKP